MNKKKSIIIVLMVLLCIIGVGILSYKFLEGKKMSDDIKQSDNSIKENNPIIYDQITEENESTMQGSSKVENNDLNDNKNNNNSQKENADNKATSSINKNTTSKTDVESNDDKSDVSSSNIGSDTPPSDANKTEPVQDNNKPIETNKPEVIVFYESITHGKKEFATEQEALKRGEEIAYNELNYVISQNKLNGENTMKPDIRYFRVYPSIKDEDGKTWYYLHFFCESGEGNDDKLKSMY